MVGAAKSTQTSAKRSARPIRPHSARRSSSCRRTSAGRRVSSADAGTALDNFLNPIQRQALGAQDDFLRTLSDWVLGGSKSDPSKNHTAWIDQKLHFPIKNVGAGGDTWELQNLKEGSQDASLFEIPAGYRKMDMGGMMMGRPQD